MYKVLQNVLPLHYRKKEAMLLPLLTNNQNQMKTEKQITIQVLKFGTVAETLKRLLKESDRHTSSWTCFGSENIIKENTHLRNKISVFFIETVAIGGEKGFDFCQYNQLTKKFVRILKDNQSQSIDKGAYYEWTFTFTYNVFVDAQNNKVPFGTYLEKYVGVKLEQLIPSYAASTEEYSTQDYGNRFNGGTWYFPTDGFKEIPLIDINGRSYKTKAVKDSKDYSFLIVPV